MTAPRVRLATTLLLCLVSHRAFAQAPSTRAARSPSTGTSSGRLVEVSVFGHIGSLTPAAQESFEAVLGSASGQVVGGGGEVRLVRGRLRGLFGRVDVSRFRERGERVFVFEGEVFELGIPLTITMTPIEFTGGYRYVRRGRAGRAFPIVPYGGIGVGTMQYREESPFGETGDDVNERFASYHALGGVDVRVWRWIGVGVEGQYRWVPDGLGEGGVSQEFNETNLGGATIRARVGVMF